MGAHDEARDMCTSDKRCIHISMHWQRLFLLATGCALLAVVCERPKSQLAKKGRFLNFTRFLVRACKAKDLWPSHGTILSSTETLASRFHQTSYRTILTTMINSRSTRPFENSVPRFPCRRTSMTLRLLKGRVYQYQNSCTAKNNSM